MKAIVFRHEHGGTYVMDDGGVFRFIHGYTSKPVGAEIDIKPQYHVSIKRLAPIAICIILALVLGICALLWNTI